MYKFGEAVRRRIYTLAGLLTLIGIFAMRWNVVIGGQLFSKSFLGYTTYKMAFCDARRIADRHCPFDPALPDSVGTTEAASALGGAEGLMTASEDAMSAPSTNSDPAPGSGDLGELILQVQDLRQRVLNLEKRLGTTVAAPEVPVSAPPLPGGFDLPPNIVPVLGRMLVAIAGAYVLRALTDWGVLPAAAGVAIGLIYALIWLWVAARSPVEAKFAAALSCSTSVLIMAPLVWEAAGRLKVMSSATSSGVLAAFALIALALGSRTQHRIIGTIAGVSSIVMAVALLLARDDIVPFTTALLVIAAAMEFAAWRDLQSGARAVAALAADFSVLLFSYLMSSPRGMPEAWVPVSPSRRAYRATRAGADLYWDRRKPDRSCGAGPSPSRKWRRPRRLF